MHLFVSYIIHWFEVNFIAFVCRKSSCAISMDIFHREFTCFSNMNSSLFPGELRKMSFNGPKKKLRSVYKMKSQDSLAIKAIASIYYWQKSYPNELLLLIFRFDCLLFSYFGKILHIFHACTHRLLRKTKIVCRNVHDLCTLSMLCL